MEEKNKGKAKFEVSDIGGQVPSKHRTYRRTNNVKASKNVVRWADPKYVEEDVEMRTILGRLKTSRRGPSKVLNTSRGRYSMLS